MEGGNKLLITTSDYPLVVAESRDFVGPPKRIGKTNPFEASFFAAILSWASKVACNAIPLLWISDTEQLP